MKRITIAALATAVLASLTGCSSVFDTKPTEFGCSGMPQGVKCLSVKDVYSATEASDYVNGEVAQKWRERNEKKELTAASNSEASVATPEKTPAADKPTPIRHPAKIMRVWINSFEDDDGDLYAGQYVFTEIEPRRWSVGVERGEDKDGLSPLSSGNRNSIRETESPLSSKKK